MSKIEWYLRTNLKMRHLQLLVVLDEERHIGRAAKRLNVTQPAISKMLLVFEEGFQVKLFERNTRGMEPTEAGRCLIKYAKDILAKLSAAHDDLLDILEGRASRISLGILPAVSLNLIPRFIAHLDKEPMNSHITLFEGTSNNLLAMLRTGDLDLVFSSLYGQSLGSEFAVKKLYHDPIVVATRKNHPLATQSDLQWQDLSGYPMVLPPKFATTRSLIESFLLNQRITVSNRLLGSLSTLTNIGVLNETDALGFLVKSAADYFEELGVISVLPISVHDVYLDIGLVWLKNKDSNLAQQHAIELLSTFCEKSINH